MTIHFTSDLHFGHKAMAAHRGFGTDVEGMDNALRHGWNHRVSPDDTTYVLGDLSFHKLEQTSRLLRGLNGKIIVVPGNHDNPKMLEALEKRGLIETARQLLEVKFVRQVAGKSEAHHFVLCHYPILQWNRRHYGAIHLHGHSHGSCRYPGGENPGRVMDVGVDAIGMIPLSLGGVFDIMLQREATSADHHKITSAA